MILESSTIFQMEVSLELIAGPAPEAVTERIFEISKELKEYKTTTIEEVDLTKIGTSVYGNLQVEIVHSTADYKDLMHEIFDFGAIKHFILSNPKFTFLFDAMHAVTGPYAKEIFITELGLPSHSVINAIPLEDFNGGHPDPNLTVK